MKSVLRVILAMFLPLSVLLCACTGEKTAFTEKNAPHHFNELRAVEALLETDPAKAMDSLSGLMEASSESSLTPLDYVEMQLRMVQAQYKNRTLTEDGIDLAPVVSFYDSLAVTYPDDADLQFLRANAYYYKGVELAFANEDVEAFAHYLKALEVMQLRDDWTDCPYAKRFVALAYTRLSEILYHYGIHEAAAETCRKAASFYESETDLAAMKRFEATICQSQKQYDKAMALFQDAEGMVPVGDEPMQLVVGTKFFELQQYDSAVPHLLRAFANGDRYARIDAAAKLAEVYCDKDMGDLELAYTRYYVQNSMMETRMASCKMEIEYLYDEFNHPKAADVPSEENEMPSSLLLSLFLLMVIAFLGYIIVRNRKRISHIENKISTFEQKRGQKDTEENKPTVQPLVAQPETLENVVKVDFETSWNAFVNSPIALKIKHSLEGKDIMIKSVGVYPKLKLKEMDYIELVQEVNREFPDFSVRFLKRHPDLNVSDFRHGCLALLGFNDAEIAVLEGISYSGTNRRSNKILSALDSGDSLQSAMITCLKNLYN